jgi:hypothetical protein
VSFIVSNKFGSFHGKSFERIIDERVHDVHSFFGNTCFGVDLSQNFVDIDGE